MTWGFTAQRRADEFNDRVEGGGSTGGETGRDADLLELVGAMRAVPEIHARPEFVSELRAQLMAEAETALAPVDTSRLRLPERAPRRERRIAAVVGGIAIVGATTSVAVASQSALPGDTLYPIKRAIEGAHTGLSVGEGNKGATVLANASDRLAEVEALAREDQATADLQIPDTLTTFTDQATEASDLLLADYAHNGEESSIEELREFATASLDTLASLEPLVPPEARDELIRAAQVLQTIDAQAAQACPTCGTASIESIPPVLVSAAEQIFVPDVAEQTGGAGGRADERAGDRAGERASEGRRQGVRNGGRPDLPEIPAEGVGPGSVLNPSTAPTLPGGGTSPDKNPLQQLADDLAGGLPGGKGDGPSSQPSLPVVGPLLGGVGDLLESVVDPLVAPLTGGQSEDDKKKKD